MSRLQNQEKYRYRYKVKHAIDLHLPFHQQVMFGLIFWCLRVWISAITPIRRKKKMKILDVSNSSTRQEDAAADVKTISPRDAASTPHTSPVEWQRVPEICRCFGLKRSKVYELISRGVLKSASLRQKGSLRGIRIVSCDSVRTLLESSARRRE